MAKYKYWYLKRRDNPQLGTYYYRLGNISQAAAKRAGGSLYGQNNVLRFESSDELEKEIVRLIESGETIQN